MTRPAQLREAHAHIPSHGRSLSMLNVDKCGSAGDCLELVAREAARVAAGEWVLAVGARVESWEGARWPTRAELDAATRGRACCVMSFDHHAVVANTEAMRIAGIVEGVSDPVSGVVCRDSGGVATGLLLEAAAYQVWNAAPEPSESQWREYVRLAVHDLARYGFTEVHDLLSPRWLGPVLRDLEGRGELPVSIWMYVPLAEVEERHKEATGSRGWGKGSDRVRLAGAKVFADGTLNSATAWMLEPYAHPLQGMERGKVITPPAALREARERTMRLGLSLAVHAIGDGAVRAVLDAEEGIRRQGKGGSGLRIEHCELIDEVDVPRFAELGVVASVQPCHLLADIEVLQRQLPHRLERVLPLRELVDAGSVPGKGLIFGSDTPIVRPDPEDSIQAAVRRRRVGMTEAVAPGQAIREAEAWACFGRAG